MSKALAAIIGGAAGAVAFVGIVVLLVCFYLSYRESVSRASETGSSDPSVQVGTHVGIELSLQDTKHFNLEELSLATNNFSEKNLIGAGKFGEVYKGLLRDGIFVAIKKRYAAPSQEFINEVRYLSSIQHRNLVTLLGYCQENNMQFLVYDHVPSGSVSSHLYGTDQHSGKKLEFKIRLSIALGAAKGLGYIHSLSPRLIHKNFKTANVLVDENFIAKVADAGLHNFLGRTDIITIGPSSLLKADENFIAPEVKEFRRFSEKSDVYSFGAFLLELVSGKEATEVFNLNQSFVHWVTNNVPAKITKKMQSAEERSNRMSSIIDKRMPNNFTAEGMEEMMRLIVHCVEASSERRPRMSFVVMELDRILEKEMNLTTLMGEGTPTVTLGSQLFRPSK